MKLRCWVKLEGKFSCKINNAESYLVVAETGFWCEGPHELRMFVLKLSLQSGFSSAVDCGSEGQKCHFWTVS